jgi:LacI family transcriptional regulator
LTRALALVPTIGMDKEQAIGIPPTIKDLARVAGVSIASASNAMNNTGRLSTELRERIIASARQIGYLPSLAAKALKGQRSKIVAVLTDGLSGQWYGEILDGLHKEFTNAGFAMMTTTLATDALELVQGLLRSRFIQGVVVLNPMVAAPEVLLPIVHSGPAVLFDAEDCYAFASRYNIDNRGGIVALMEHLWQQGARDFVWIDGEESALAARERRAACEEYLGLQAPGEWTLERVYGGFRAALALQNLSAYLDTNSRLPQAVLAANDESALGAIQALQQRGVAIPEQVRVCGFDGLDNCQWSNPPLTSIAFDRRALGAAMAADLLGQLKGGTEGGLLHSIPYELVVRASSA